MQKPMIKMNREMTGQPMEIATGPPLFQAWAKVVKHPAKIEIIEKEIAKFEKPDQDLLSSCLYPSSARRFSSSFVIAKMYSSLRLWGVAFLPHSVT